MESASLLFLHHAQTLQPCFYPSHPLLLLYALLIKPLVNACYVADGGYAGRNCLDNFWFSRRRSTLGWLDQVRVILTYKEECLRQLILNLLFVTRFILSGLLVFHHSRYKLLCDAIIHLLKRVVILGLGKLPDLTILSCSLTLFVICQNLEVDEGSVFGRAACPYSLRLDKVNKVDLDALVWARSIDTAVLHRLVEHFTVRACIHFPVGLFVT